MTDFVEVNLDDKAEKAISYYRTFVEGNNALKLQEIPLFRPLVVGSNLKPGDYDAKRAELVDRVHIAAQQLNEHYDQIADANPKFIPYWDQETRFNSAISSMPEIQRKKFFESYKKFFERNGIEERIELDKNMQYFHPFYSKDSKQLTYERLNEKFRFFGEKRWPLATIGAFGAAVEISVGLHATLMEHPSTATGILGYSAGLILLLMVGHFDNREHWREIDVFRRDMSSRAHNADKIISTIKEFA